MITITKNSVFNLTFQREEGLYEGCLATVATLPENALSLLSVSERKRYDTYTVSKRKETFLMGRYAAKEALSGLDSQMVSSEVSIESGVFQQPFVVGTLSQELDVSLSHSNGVGVACAFPRAHPLGIDIEEICLDRDAALSRYITDKEKSLYENVCVASPQEWLYLNWTAKEALSKVLKCGLMTPFSVLALNHYEQLSSCHWVGTFEHFAQYQFQVWMAPPYMMALVLPKRSRLQLVEAATV